MNYFQPNSLATCCGQESTVLQIKINIVPINKLLIIASAVERSINASMYGDGCFVTSSSSQPEGGQGNNGIQQNSMPGFYQTPKPGRLSCSTTHLWLLALVPAVPGTAHTYKPELVLRARSPCLLLPESVGASLGPCFRGGRAALTALLVCCNVPLHVSLKAYIVSSVLLYVGRGMQT